MVKQGYEWLCKENGATGIIIRYAQEGRQRTAEAMNLPSNDHPSNLPKTGGRSRARYRHTSDSAYISHREATANGDVQSRELPTFYRNFSSATLTQGSNLTRVKLASEENVAARPTTSWLIRWHSLWKRLRKRFWAPLATVDRHFHLRSW